MSTRANNLTRLIVLITIANQCCPYQPIGRWGQRTAVASNGLFVYGGKSDQYNEFSYTSAPNINDLLFLPLGGSFSSSSPPWQLLNGSPPQSGPVAWHTISSINDSSLLLFGGQPGYSSASLDLADSAYILNLPKAEWVPLPQTWANEPIRRIRHSSASIPLGSIVMVGGEKADGSGNALPDNYIFNPNNHSFVQLSNAAGPSGIYDHASVVLSDGRLLVLGGYNQLQGSLVPFSSVWLLDSRSNTPNWSLVPTSNASLPDPRRAFAAVSLYDDNILIHGGSDASLQQNFADGWMLNTSSNPMTWTEVEMLTLLGPRRDHFAVAVASGYLVLFGFGYGDSAPASPTLYIYDVVRNNFVTTYTATPSGSGITQTYPQLTSSTHIRHSETASDGSSTGVSSGNVPNANDNSAHVRNLALLATFACLAVAVAILAALFYARRYRQQHDGSGHFFSLGDDGESKHSHPIPTVVMVDQEPIAERRPTFAFFNSLRSPGSLAALGRNVEQPIARRRNMLADEDAYDEGQWYLLRRERNVDRSSWSFKSFISRNREASTTNLSGATHAHEKSDPFAHDDLYDEAMSLKLEREQVLAPDKDSMSTHLPYRDPFVDPVDHIHEDRANKASASAHLLGTLSYYDSLSRNVSMAIGPLSEQASQSSLPLNDSSGSSTQHKDILSVTTSTDATLTYPLATSLINANPGPATPISRTDSWWKRFTRNSFVDRKLSITSRRSPSMDFKEYSTLLEPIEERMNLLALKSVSNGLVEYGNNQVKSRSASASDNYGGSHGRSLSSLKTAGTDAIEKIGGAMDVVQRVRTRSHYSSSSMTRDRLRQSSNGSDDIDELFTSQGLTISPVQLESPVNYIIDGDRAFRPQCSSRALDPMSPVSTAPELPLDGLVAARRQEYERRLSQHKERTQHKVQEGMVTVKYGLAPRQSLFIANPDKL